MLIKTTNGWVLAESMIRYTQNDEEKEQVVGEEGTEWWLDFAEKWGHTNIIEFTPLNYTADQLARLEEIQEIGEGYADICNDYVIDGIITNAKPFQIMKLKKEKAELEGVVEDLVQVLVDKGVVW